MTTPLIHTNHKCCGGRKSGFIGGFLNGLQFFPHIKHIRKNKEYAARLIHESYCRDSYMLHIDKDNIQRDFDTAMKKLTDEPA
jgi:hypothetical protein